MSATIGIITARGGSKGLPGKNIKAMHGKPLIAWTIEAALASCLEHVYVSTDDPDIRACAVEYGAETLSTRPAHLANDVASVQDVLIEHVAPELALGEDAILCLLQPTSPLRRASHIDEACALYARHGEPVISLMPHQKPLAWLYEVDGAGYIERPFHQDDVSRRQDSTHEYMLPNGALYVASLAQWRAGLWSRRVMGYVMKKSESIDIDTPEDWLLAQALLGAR